MHLFAAFHKDILLQLRGRAQVVAIFVFGATSLLLFSFAIGPNAAALLTMAVTISALYFVIEPRDEYHSRLLTQALAMTTPGEPILDLKGETVFRPRPTYIVLDGSGRDALRRGRIRGKRLFDGASVRGF